MEWPTSMHGTQSRVVLTSRVRVQPLASYLASRAQMLSCGHAQHTMHSSCFDLPCSCIFDLLLSGKQSSPCCCCCCNCCLQLLFNNRYGFHFPLLVTTTHMTCTFGWAALVRWYLARWQGVKYERVTWGNTIRRIFPAGAAGAFDIGLSNAALGTDMHINLYTICKSTVVCFVLLFSFIFKLQKPTWELFLVVVMVVGGVILFQAQDNVSFHSSGFVLVMMASAFGGLRWVLTQVLLKSTSFGERDAPS
jgi:hypothetical protein